MAQKTWLCTALQAPGTIQVISTQCIQQTTVEHEQDDPFRTGGNRKHTALFCPYNYHFSPNIWNSPPLSVNFLFSNYSNSALSEELIFSASPVVSVLPSPFKPSPQTAISWGSHGFLRLLTATAVWVA